MGFEDVFGKADAVANGFYAHATEQDPVRSTNKMRSSR